VGDLLTIGGVLAAFFAGGVALFAPCCIVFLAPSYLAAAVKNRRWRLLPLTFLFAAGLAAVLVPITVGISLIAGAIARYHTVLYYAGGMHHGGQPVLSGGVMGSSHRGRTACGRAVEKPSRFELGSGRMPLSWRNPASYRANGEQFIGSRTFRTSTKPRAGWPRHAPTFCAEPRELPGNAAST
jgi:hypothetical protein